jgi:hypothetical protein
MMDVLQEIGASLRNGDDGYGYDAANAVEQVKTLTGV